MADQPVRPHVTLHQVPGGDTVVLALHGEHDIATAPQVREALLLAASRRTLVVDLAACTFLDGSILGLLIGARRRVVRRGGTVVVVNAHGAPLRALDTRSGTYTLTVFDAQGARLHSRVSDVA